MPNARLHHSMSYGRHLAPQDPDGSPQGFRGARPRRSVPLLSRLLLPMLAAAVLLIGASLGRASSGAARFVEKVEATSGNDGVQIEVTTTSAAAPTFSVFPLREPNRLVMDIPDFLWKPGLTAHLPSANPAVEQVRVGQVSLNPPVTRVVFDLAAPTRLLRYRAASSTADGNLRVELSEQPSAVQDSGGWLSIRSAPARPAGAPVTLARARPSSRAGAPLPAQQAKPARPVSPALATLALGSATAAGEQRAPAPGIESAPNHRPAVVPPSPSVASTRPIAQPSLPPVWDDPAIRAALALALLAFTGILAIWMRRRFQKVSERRASTAGLAADGETPTAPEPETAPATDTQQADLLRCKVVDGYLVLAPQGGAGETHALPGTARAKVERGTLDLDFSGAKAQQPQHSADDAPVAATQAADLVASLADQTTAVRRAAAQGLLEIAAAGHCSALLPYLQSSDPKVRSVVAGVLGDAGAVDCLPDVARLAGDPDASVRACVMYAFAQYGESAAAYAGSVRSRLSDPESGVRAGAIEALATLSPRSEDAAGEVIQFTADPDPLVRQAAASATFGFAVRGVAGPLIDLLGDFTRRAQALEVLQQADDAVLWRLLVACRTSASASAQAAIDTLSYVMSRRWTADDFKEEIESSDSETRLTGIEGLSMVGGPEAMSHIRRLAEADSSPEVRRRASEILSQWQAWGGTGTPASAEAEGLRTEA